MNIPQRTTLLRRTGRPVNNVASSRLSKAKSFVSLSDKLNAQGDDYSIAHEAVDGLMTLLGARAGLIFLPAPVDVTYAKYDNRSEALARFEQNLPDCATEILSDSALKPRKRVHSTEGLILVPLTWQGQSIGLVALDRLGRMPAPHDEAVLLSLCNQLAAIIGLRNRPGNIVPAQNAIPQEEMASAAAMQHTLLPSIPPSLGCGLSIATHTQSAGFVGGDYFDLILVDQNKMGIVIADVEGKGVPAALFSNMLRTTVHFLTRETPSTASVMGKINTILHNEAVALQKLFTMFYAVYNSADRMLTYTGSGHISPIVIRGEREHVDRLHSDGTLIGIDPIQRFSERSVSLQPNDIVLFFTDGLPEYRNETMEMYGEQRLISVLQVHKQEAPELIVSALLDDVAAFTNQPPTDDFTVVVAKVL